MTGHLEAEGMSSEILGREAEEGRRPRQGDKMREARQGQVSPLCGQDEGSLLLRAALPLLREMDSFLRRDLTMAWAEMPL